MASILCDELLADLSFAAQISRFTETESSELFESQQTSSEAPSSMNTEPLDCGRFPVVPRVTGLDIGAEEARDDVFSPDASVKSTSTSAPTDPQPSSSKTWADVKAMGSIVPAQVYSCDNGRGSIFEKAPPPTYRL